ncbi:adenosylcobinamide-GDP ribazoletransferase [Inhella inkyongensis]|uniref:Adenosylcobinamide-GDP ribazoletransferase n=1 Tax=Inhella inkyongensis TaxID=392593 RepID=A0A840S5R7_9BURK|nr:adenosylcobinamide-GDP ribazoletransferase [Inhella inkyongensis]MBB5204838.1 adenosylcobinamide-GDP ribazoletransferase [Inhella inkyongensis]
MTIRWTEEVRLIAVALQFLTRCPVPARWLAPWQPDWLNACVRHFPLVGAGVGAFSAAVLWGAAQFWGPWVAALLALAAGAWATGAFHEDGLADTMDALGGAVSREKALTIMKDSRIGSYGALALILITGLRAAALAELVAHSATGAALLLIATHALARSLPLGLMMALPYAGDAEHAKAKPLATGVRGPQVLPGLLWLAPLPLLIGWPSLVQALAVLLLLLGLLLRRWYARRLGGYTGDTLGAAEQLGEAALLLLFAARV